MDQEMRMRAWYCEREVCIGDMELELQGLDGRAVLFTWCSTTTIVCDVIALVLCWHLGLIGISLTCSFSYGVCVGIVAWSRNTW